MRAWRPSSEAPGSSGLTVPYRGSQKMTRQLYESLLENRLRDLINQNPKEAYWILSGLPEHNPDLYEIAVGSPQEDWPAQILACGQMQM
jgi:hypothetical protein